MLFDFSNENSPKDTYKIMSQTIIPRPIAWVVTEDEGVVNIAPFSYFIGLSSDPASVLISAGHRPDGSPKDTLSNIRKHKKCTICMVEEDDLEKMHCSSVSLPHEQSEVDYCGIPTEGMDAAYPPRITTAPVAYFCELNQEIDLGGGSTIPLVLNVKAIYVDERVITDKERMAITFRPVARIGKRYAFLGEEVEPPAIP